MNKKSKNLVLTVLVTAMAGVSQAQQITHWTEHNSTLGLGFPVPIPVDTPEPFDGFRSYNGLHSKHMEITAENDHVTSHVIGQTINNRDIWAYRLSDADRVTKYGVQEGGMLMNGGIHAREWQTPETVTGIMEHIHANRHDQSLNQFLLENTEIVVIPVNNVDGFLQTQRYPTSNYYSNQQGPRDGRMRRKNMRNVDEVLTTQSDHLLGIDLNRNNDPYWAATENSGNPRSSGDPSSIVHRGSNAFSEPESVARLNAVNLLDEDHLRIYTDVHSFSQVHYSVYTFNQNRNNLQTRLLTDFTNYHKQLSGNKNYVDLPSPAGYGIGSTDEYFAYTYQVPSWTLEIEPTNTFNPDVHPELPGHSADYGGFANDGHDGFILPDSEIKRVRENLAKAFVATWYGQAGPPSITQVRIYDPESKAIIFDAEWDIVDNDNRELFVNHIGRLMPDRDYQVRIRFDKPMRIKDNQGQASNLPGISLIPEPIIQLWQGDNELDLSFNNGKWINESQSDWESFHFYKNDTFIAEFRLPENTPLEEINWYILATDLLGQSNDGNPATVVTWQNGQWQNYENSLGQAAINGGFDKTIFTPVQAHVDHFSWPRVSDTGLFYDPSYSGEGISFETLENNRFWLSWFTFDDQGGQDWYVADGQFEGNVVKANPIYTNEGGAFGDAFDPENVTFRTEGELEMLFSEPMPLDPPIGTHHESYTIATKYTAPNGQKFRRSWSPLALAEGFGLGGLWGSITPPPPGKYPPSFTGSWYSPERSGEGYHIEILVDGRAVLQWYGFDPEGNKRWFIDDNGTVTETDTGIKINFDQVYSTFGTVFGSEFNANDIYSEVWGSAEFILNCYDGSMTYQSNDAAFGSGGYDIEPLTRPIWNLYRCQ